MLGGQGIFPGPQLLSMRSDTGRLGGIQNPHLEHDFQLYTPQSQGGCPCPLGGRGQKKGTEEADKGPGFR